jgi:hypothetical protein
MMVLLSEGWSDVRRTEGQKHILLLLGGNRAPRAYQAFGMMFDVVRSVIMHGFAVDLASAGTERKKTESSFSECLR